MFQNVRRTNWPTFVLVALLALSFPIIFWYSLPSSFGWFGQEISNLSRGLLGFSTPFNTAEACIVVIVICLTSRLKLRDLGLSSNLGKAIIFTALLWTLTQAALFVWQLIVLGAPQWNSAWQEMVPTFVLGTFISQILGNSLYEEIVFRGFIFVQLYLFLTHRKIRRPLLTALLTSQVFFALLHIPMQLVREGVSWSGLLFWLTATGVAGIIFALCYAKTQNLFIAVGIHALFNAPVQLFLPPTEDSQLPATFVTLLALALIFLPPFSRLWETSPKPLNAQTYSGTDA